jgi:hypothetical protein
VWRLVEDMRQWQERDDPQKDVRGFRSGDRVWVSGRPAIFC